MMEVERDDDIKQIDAGVKNKFNWHWLKSKDVEWCCPWTLPGARLPPGPSTNFRLLRGNLLASLKRISRSPVALKCM